MPRPGRFARTVPRRRAFGNAVRALRRARRARRRVIVTAVVAAIRRVSLKYGPGQTPANSHQIFPAQGANDYNHTEETTTEPLQNDEDILDEYLRGHERGFRLGLSRGHDRGYRQGVATGYAYGLSHGQQVAYDAGFEAGIAYNREYQ
ncbi:hypothetical protein MRS44_012131 [Fusarium solani]|uniref:uncharacterized protein n=1 Tax=Fusarium solani TaxID=169388 RepID=UPI0032C495E9|nr:hypothetical protein MRS44_012131 [Fusarium solani]